MYCTLIQMFTFIKHLLHMPSSKKKDTDNILTDGTLASSQGGWWKRFHIDRCKEVIEAFTAENNFVSSLQF